MFGVQLSLHKVQAFIASHGVFVDVQVINHKVQVIIALIMKKMDLPVGAVELTEAVFEKSQLPGASLFL